jgi:hypothetical protein
VEFWTQHPIKQYKSRITIHKATRGKCGKKSIHNYLFVPPQSQKS